MIHSPWINLFATITWCCCDSALLRNGAWSRSLEGPFNFTYNHPLLASKNCSSGWIDCYGKIKIIKDFWIRRLRSKEFSGCLDRFSKFQKSQFLIKSEKKWKTNEFEKYHKILWNIQFYVIEIEIRICHVWNKKRICQTATFCSNTLRVTLCYFKTEAVTWPVTRLHF